MIFKSFAQLVDKQVDKMSKHDLYYVDVEVDKLYDLYIASFPSGTNEMYIERTEHDCSCCKSFIRRIGHMVAIINGKIVTIWDVAAKNEYDVVSKALAEFVRAAAIKGVYLSETNKVGQATTNQAMPNNAIKTWNHFHAKLPNKFVVSGESIASAEATKRADKEVLVTSLTKYNDYAIDTVLELINDNNLERGQERKHTVESLRKTKTAWDKLTTDVAREQFAWKTAAKLGSAGRFRNNVIGTLLDDLAEGKDLEKAVKSYETKVAGENFMRTSSLVTKTQVKSAFDKVEEKGMTDSFTRQHAKITDISVANVIHANRESKLNMDGVFGDIIESIGDDKLPDPEQIKDIRIDDFIAKIVPKAKKLEVMVANSQTTNLMSLLTPTYLDAPGIFKWGNNFSWSYNGDVADSIKERVKAAGGNVAGDLRISASWYNTDDLDLRVKEPNRNMISFMDPKSTTTGGKLDVDANSNSHQLKTDPVENITYANKAKVLPGKHVVEINNYTKRDTNHVGCEVEIEYLGTTWNFEYSADIPRGKTVKITEFDFDITKGLTFGKGIASKSASKEIWGIQTNKWSTVSTMMFSPNHWEGEDAGHKHVFFIIKDCLNPDTVRTFYNEFLSSDLVADRKVFEIVGARTKAAYSDQQLSGIGFSTTRRSEIKVRVTGEGNKVYNVQF